MTCTHPNQSSYLQFQNAQKCDDRERKTYEVLWLPPVLPTKWKSCTKMSFAMSHDSQKTSLVLRRLKIWSSWHPFEEIAKKSHPRQPPIVQNCKKRKTQNNVSDCSSRNVKKSRRCQCTHDWSMPNDFWNPLDRDWTQFAFAARETLRFYFLY